MHNETMTPVAVANYLLKLAEKKGVNDMIPLKLMKLVYLCHGWHLGSTGHPLVNEEAKARLSGPVFISLHEATREFLGSPKTIYPVGGDTGQPGKGQKGVIEMVFNAYKGKNWLDLLGHTNENESPWARVWEAHPCSSAPIPNGYIRQYYSQILHDHIGEAG